MKRVFTDADIYDDEWYQDLTKDQKLFWDYICRRSEYGVWKPNFRLAKFQLGLEVIDPEEMITAFNQKKIRVEITTDKRWFIPSWILFQYPTLSENCPAHRPLFKFYYRNYRYLFDRYLKGIYTLQEIEIEKDIEIKKEKEVLEESEKPFNAKFNQLEAFNEIWELYPAKGRLNRSASLRVWCEIVVRREESLRIQTALENYSAHLKANSDWGKQPMNLLKWLEQWSDWENHKEPEKEETVAERDARIIEKYSK